MTKLFYIKDSVSQLRITGFMEMPNDGVAIKSFQKFTEDKPEDEKELFELWCSGFVDNDDNIDVHKYFVCNGKTAKENFQAFLSSIKEE